MPLSDRDEGEYAAATAEMIRNNDMLVPMLNGKVYFEKPLFIFQGISTSWRFTGMNEAGARLPSLLAAILAMGVLSYVSMKISLFTPGNALFLFVTGFSSPLFLMTARACLTDMPLACFITLSLLCFFLAFEGCTRYDRPLYLLAWFFMGAGFLTKGLVATAVIMVSAVIYAAVRGRLWQTILKDSMPITGLVCFLALTLPWYGTMYLKFGNLFLESFFLDQHFKRIRKVTLGHGGGLFFYIPVLMLLVFPTAQACLAGIIERWDKNVNFILKKGSSYDLPDKFRFFCLVVSLVVLALFSIASTKQINYILPMLPFASVIATDWLVQRSVDEGSYKDISRKVFFILITAAAVVWIIFYGLMGVKNDYLWTRLLGAIDFDSSEYALPTVQPVFPFISVAGILLTFLVSVSAFKIKFKDRYRRAFHLFPVLLTVFSLLFTSFLMPSVAEVIQTPSRELCADVRALKGDYETVSYGLWKPSMLFYMDRRIPRFKIRDSFTLDCVVESDRPVFVFTRQRLLEYIEKMENVFPIKRYGGYLLCGNEAALDLWKRHYNLP